MGNEKNHGGLNMFKYNGKHSDDYISTGQMHLDVRTIKIDISEGEILTLMNEIPKVYSIDSENYRFANFLYGFIQKLQKGWEQGEIKEIEKK